MSPIPAEAYSEKRKTKPYLIYDHMRHAVQVVTSAQTPQYHTRGAEQDLCFVVLLAFSPNRISHRPVVQSLGRNPGSNRDGRDSPRLGYDYRRL
jgi:hypothetical protein